MNLRRIIVEVADSPRERKAKLNMGPQSAMNNRRNCHRGNVELSRQFASGSPFAICYGASYLKNLLRRQLAHAVALPAIVRRAKPTLTSGVLHVIRVIAEKQMIWTNAGRIIAAMAYELAIGNRPVVQFPRKTMCDGIAMYPSATRGDGEMPIAIFARAFESAGPNPASIGFLDIRPESLNWIDSFLGRFLVTTTTAVFPSGMPRWSKCAPTK